jgi:hypothetical protein
MSRFGRGSGVDLKEVLPSATGVLRDYGLRLDPQLTLALKAMGQVRRQLWRVAGEGALPPAPGTPLRGAENHLAGEVRSAAADGRGGWIGLAMISLHHAPPEGRLLLPGDTQPSVRRRPAL